jgi:hypothetical protein
MHSSRINNTISLLNTQMNLANNSYQIRRKIT